LLRAQEIADLGKEETATAKAANPPQPVTAEIIARDQQRIIVAGYQPPELTAKGLTERIELPLLWSEQGRAVGIN
jgi:hypothetical protein